MKDGKDLSCPSDRRDSEKRGWKSFGFLKTWVPR